MINLIQSHAFISLTSFPSKLINTIRIAYHGHQNLLEVIEIKMKIPWIIRLNNPNFHSFQYNDAYPLFAKSLFLPHIIDLLNPH